MNEPITPYKDTIVDDLGCFDVAATHIDTQVKRYICKPTVILVEIELLDMPVEHLAEHAS